jgi:hypothetical protein
MQITAYRLCFTLLALNLFQTSGLAQQQSRGISLLLLPRMKPDSVDSFLREAKNGRAPAQIFIAVGVNFACREKDGGVACDVPPYENARRVADELLNAGKRVTMIFYFSFHANSAAHQAKRRENLINRLGPEFLAPLGDWRSRGLSLYLSPSLEDEMTEDSEWKAAADEMANKLVASLNPAAWLAGGIRFLRNPIEKSVGVPNSIVVNGCGGQCRFGVYREHHGLVKENALGQKS